MGPPVRGAGRARRPMDSRTEARFHAGAAGVSWAHVQGGDQRRRPRARSVRAPAAPGPAGLVRGVLLGRARRDPHRPGALRAAAGALPGCGGPRRAARPLPPPQRAALGGARRRWAARLRLPRLALRQRRPLRPRPRPRGPGRQPRPPVRRLPRAGAAGGRVGLGGPERPPGRGPLVLRPRGPARLPGHPPRPLRPGVHPRRRRERLGCAPYGLSAWWAVPRRHRPQPHPVPGDAHGAERRACEYIGEARPEGLVGRILSHRAGWSPTSIASISPASPRWSTASATRTTSWSRPPSPPSATTRRACTRSWR